MPKKSETNTTAVVEAQFHNLYRPRTLDKVIGQEAAVARLKGIIENKRYPSTILFTGPPSAGKTTLARAFAAGVLDVKTLKGHPDFHEINGSANGKIEEIRSMLQMARLRPRQRPRRIFMIDEVHGLSGASLEAVLKPFEEPPPYTMWLLGTSEPEKLKNSLKTRGSSFALKAYSREDMLKYAKRIVKAESMDYMTDELVETVVENANGELRTICQLLEAIVQSAGSGGKIKKEDVLKSLSTVETDEAKVAMNILYETYNKNPAGVYRHLLDCTDGFRMVSLLLSFNSFLINAAVLKGEKHRSVWWNKNNGDLHKAVSEIVPKDKFLTAGALVQDQLLEVRRLSGAFMTSEQQLLGNHLHKATKSLKKILK